MAGSEGDANTGVLDTLAAQYLKTVGGAKYLTSPLTGLTQSQHWGSGVSSSVCLGRRERRHAFYNLALST